MDNTYLDITTDTVRLRHKVDWGAKPFHVPANEWQAHTFSELMAACKDARTRGGGSIFINGEISVEDTVVWPNSSTKVFNGVLKATGDKWKDQQHLTSVKNAENLMFLGTVWNGQKKPILCCPIVESTNVAFIDTVHHACKTGPSAERSSRMSFVGISSFGHKTWHGLNPGQDEDCERVSVLSCNIYSCNAYALDYHGSKMEAAGNKFWNCGLTGSYLGVCVKFPRGRDIWMHNNYVSCDTSGLGLIFIYEMKGLAPKDVYVYRNWLECSSDNPHFNIASGLQIDHADNIHSSDVKVRGGGKLVYNDMLTYLPDAIDTSDPIESESRTWTEDEITSIVDESLREAFLAIANNI